MPQNSTGVIVSKFKTKAKTEPFTVHTKEELKKYLPVMKIYCEMKYARKFPKQTISFFEIPAEIRVQIYRFALKLDSPLEFWAESDTPNHTFWVRLDDKKHLMHQIKSRELNLSLLRTCRTIHAEAAEVFYGENEFRFTGPSGHMVANLFVRKIYKQHFQFIKQLTMSIPLNYDGGSDPDSVRKRSNFTEQLPATSWIDKNFGYVEAWEHLVWNLLRMDRLNKLTFVLHHHMDFCDGEINTVFWDKIKQLLIVKPELQLEVVRLAYPDAIAAGTSRVDYEGEWDDTCEGLWKAAGLDTTQISAIQNLKRMAKECSVKAAYIERRGKWAIIEVLREEALLPAAKDERKDTDGEVV